VSRLRNRIRKADYFTDGELLRWHRDKRTTYTGLWAIAEDSGCLEDDPFTWKLLIWGSPLDADITVELLTQWRDELVAAGKLIPYEAEGKPFLYIRTFHQHEHPRNPQSPDLPLPPWVVCDFKEGKSADGKAWRRTHYTDTNHHDEPQYRHGTEPVQHLDTLPCPALPCIDKSIRRKRVPSGTAPLAPVDKSRYCPHDGSTIQHDGHCTVCDYKETPP